jgi:hypothetical protein
MRSLGPTSHTRLRARDHYVFKRSHWWKRGSRSEFPSNGVCEDGCTVYMDSYEWIMFHGHLDYF